MRSRLRATAARVARGLLAPAALGLLLPGSAAAIPFGPPLGTSPFNTLPSYPYDCSAVPAPVIGVIPLSGPNGGVATSCIWIHVPTPAEAALFPRRSIALTPPGSGTVTRISVAVGPRTGPMQVVVMRALYENTLTPGRPNDACCFPVARSQTFTPRANGITSVNVRLPIREDATPPPEDTTTIADFDTLGLAVLAPGVPVPLYYTGDTSQPGDFIWNTSRPSTVTPGFSTDSGGFFVALDGELLPTDPVGFGGGGTEPVRGSEADIALRCLASAACRGRLTLASRRTAAPDLAGARRDRPRAVAAGTTSYGSSSFRIAARGHGTVKLHLNSAGRRLFAHHRTVSVWANVTVSGVGSYSTAIRLRR